MAGKKSNYNKSGAAAAHKLRKREEAEARQRKHEALTTEEKLTKISKRRGQSLKEKARLGG